jgi:adenylosuccinate synthase
MNKVVLGCGFGDEGKGKVVSYICSLSPKPDLIVRFSGGQQAGHRVIINNIDHVFSNFGSGTLQGIPTYWSKYCTVDPVGILNELDVLKSKGINPILYIDSHCPITTPFDKEMNCNNDYISQHGTCGVGVGQTWQREEDLYSLTLYDLQYPWVLKEKLKILCRDYYYNVTNSISVIEHFLNDCSELLEYIHIVYNEELLSKKYILFEGSQGLLLDQHFGFFPHVTRSNTGLKNVVKILNREIPEVWLVTRAYQTRHGNGPMSNEHIPFTIHNQHEHNKEDGYQGKFRKTILDLDLLKYAIYKDKYIKDANKKLVITCMDVIDEYMCTKNGEVFIYSKINDYIESIARYLGISISSIYLSYGPDNLLVEYMRINDIL